MCSQDHPEFCNNNERGVCHSLVALKRSGTGYVGAEHHNAECEKNKFQRDAADVELEHCNVGKKHGPA